MEIADFNAYFQDILGTIQAVEHKKQAEYVPGGENDRLAHFKEIGAITGEPAHQALRGMMVKHTKSIYDMLKSHDTTDYEYGVWAEKCIDHMVYLVLLMAIAKENDAVPTPALEPVPVPASNPY